MDLLVCNCFNHLDVKTEALSVLFTSVIPASTSMCMYMCVSRVQLFATSWTGACQAPLFMEFSRQEYWNGLPFLAPGNLPNPGIEPGFPTLQEDS